MKLLSGSFTSASSRRSSGSAGDSSSNVARNIAMSIAKSGLPVSFLVVKEDSLGHAARATDDSQDEDESASRGSGSPREAKVAPGAIKVAVEVRYVLIDLPTLMPSAKGNGDPLRSLDIMHLSTPGLICCGTDAPVAGAAANPWP